MANLSGRPRDYPLSLIHLYNHPIELLGKALFYNVQPLVAQVSK